MNRSMRRQDRNVTELAKIKECLEDSQCLHVGFWDEGEIYIVPVNFGYELENEKLKLYFHGAKAGRKAELSAGKPMVGFEMETHVETVHGERACDFSELYLSIIGNGQVSIIEDVEEKKKALDAIMLKNSGRSDWEYPEAALNATAVFQIDVTEYTCKEHS